jgi:hypothetical protein
MSWNIFLAHTDEAGVSVTLKKALMLYMVFLTILQCQNSALHEPRNRSNFPHYRNCAIGKSVIKQTCKEFNHYFIRRYKPQLNVAIIEHSIVKQST